MSICCQNFVVSYTERNHRGNAVGSVRQFAREPAFRIGTTDTSSTSAAKVTAADSTVVWVLQKTITLSAVARRGYNITNVAADMAFDGTIAGPPVNQGFTEVAYTYQIGGGAETSQNPIGAQETYNTTVTNCTTNTFTARTEAVTGVTSPRKTAVVIRLYQRGDVITL